MPIEKPEKPPCRQFLIRGAEAEKPSLCIRYRKDTTSTRIRVIINHIMYGDTKNIRYALNSLSLERFEVRIR